MNKIKISLIVNITTKKYLEEFLDNIFSQNFRDFEIILVNSQKNNLDNLVKDYEKIKIVNSNNENINISCNSGLKLAEGRYVLFMNSYDFLQENSLELLYEKAELKQTDVLMFKSIDFFDSYNTYQTKDYFPSLNELTNKIFLAENMDNDLLFEINTNIKHLYLNSFLKENNICFSEDLLQEDLLFKFKTLFCADKISFADYPFYCSRIFENDANSLNLCFNDFSSFLSKYISFFIIFKKYLSYKKNILDQYVTFIKNYFYSLSDFDKNKYFNFIKQELTKYDFIEYDDYYENLSYENILFINLIQKSISYTDYLVNIDLRKNKNHQLISVIMPVYNGKVEDIKNAFKSVFNQSFGFENIELIIIDDCSTEKEGKNYIKLLTDLYPNVKSIFLDENKGSGHARNQGIKLASTHYIMFLDHDDTYTPDACKVLFDNIFNKDVDVVSGNYINTTPGAHKIIHWDKRNIPHLYEKTHNLHDNPSLLKIYPSIWTKIFKKSFLLDNKLFFKNFKAGQDLIFYQEVLCKVNSIKFIKDLIVNYSFRKGNSINKGSISLNRSKEILKTYINVYYTSYNLINNELPEYSYLALNNLNSWLNNKFFDTNFDYDNFKEICDFSQELFELFNNNDKTKPIKQYEQIYEDIANNNIPEAYIFYKKNNNVL